MRKRKKCYSFSLNITLFFLFKSRKRFDINNREMKAVHVFDINLIRSAGVPCGYSYFISNRKAGTYISYDWFSF